MRRPPLRIDLYSGGRAAAEAWETAFRGVPGVRIVRGDALAAEAAALVSPGNAFGFLEGSWGDALRAAFGPALERELTTRIRALPGGELPVGQALRLPAGLPGRPEIIHAPLYRLTPEAGGGVGVYLAFRAALALAHEAALDPLAAPPLGAAGALVPARRMARQMRAAYEAVFGRPPRYPSLFAARQAEEDLRR